MKALVYTQANVLVLRDEAEPPPRNDDVLVRVDAVGICGSDMHAYHGHDSRRPPPFVLGHEAAGVVISGPKAGARVAVNPLVACGVCDWCLAGRQHLCPSRELLSVPPRAGAFAERVRVPECNLVPIPDHLDMQKAALTEALAVAYHAVNLGARLLDRPISASRCVVLGGGAIGLGCALVLAMQGARDIAIGEPNAARRKTASRAADFRCYAPDEAGAPAKLTSDLVIDAVGASATRTAASRLVKPGGVIVHVGLLPGSEGLDVRKITLQEIIVAGTYCYTPLEFRETLEAIASGQLGALDWVEERPLADGPQAFRDLDAGATAAAKIVLRP
ncbi:MAG: alcohol dehydrogenase catalytic domain-containing protein [Xanthobacteraceae bacterium]